MKPFVRGKTWYIRYWYGGKDRWEAVGASKRQAELALAKRKSEIVDGRFFDPLKGNKLTYGELLDRYLKEHSAVHKKPNSYEADMHHAKRLRGCFGSLLIKDVTADRVSVYVEQRLRVGRKPATVNREMALLKHSFTLAKQWGLIRHSPVADVKRLKERNQRRRWLTHQQFEALLAEMPECQRPIIITAVNTGMRLREILSLRWGQVNFRAPVILLTDTKNGAPRDVPLNSTMVDLLRNLSRDRMRHGSASAYVFVNSLSGEPWKSIRNTFEAAVKRAGIEDFRFHDLRHTAASWLREAGADLLVLKEFLGHKTLDMVQRYAHVSSGDVLKATEALVWVHKAGIGVPDASEL